MAERRDTVSYVHILRRGGDDAKSDTMPIATMADEDSRLDTPSAPMALSALAEQLRDGPLQRLVELQIETTTLSERLANGAPARIEDVERLVNLSVAAMQHFNAFTRELAAVLSELAAGDRNRH